MRTLVGVMACGMTAAAAAGQTPGFHLIGHAPGTNIGWTTSLSQDGAVAAGYNFAGTGTAAVGFRWTAAGGRQDLTGAGVPGLVSVFGVNSTGSVRVGMMRDLPDAYHAFRETGGGLVDLGVLPNNESSRANGISGDGSIVVGQCEVGPSGNNTFGVAFRWTQSTGMQALPHLRPGGSLTQARAISRDGSTIVGLSQTGGIFGPIEAFSWTQGGGMVPLPGLPGAPFSRGEANAVNADGSVIVGSAPDENGFTRAVKWTSAGVESLGTLPGEFSLRAMAVSDDGQVIGGSTGLDGYAFVWTPSTGMIWLSDHLASSGVVVPPEWRLRYVHSISGDGLTFAGEAVSDAGVRQGFVATVPAPAGGMVVLGLGFVPRRRQRMSTSQWRMRMGRRMMQA